MTLKLDEQNVTTVFTFFEILQHRIESPASFFAMSVSIKNTNIS